MMLVCTHTADGGTCSPVARIHSDRPSTALTTSVRSSSRRITRRAVSLAGGSGAGISESAGDGPSRSRLRVRGLVNGNGSVVTSPPVLTGLDVPGELEDREI